MAIAALGMIAGAALGVGASPAQAQEETIDNDIDEGTLGHFAVEVTTGGQSTEGRLTARERTTNNIITGDVIFDYLSYVDVGPLDEAFTLEGSDPEVSGDDEVTSRGSFTGDNGNAINWTVVSSMSSGTPGVMTNRLTLEAQEGALGQMRFYQYLDEDVEGVDDDVFFTRGSVAGNDLELFTVDNEEVYGVSHSGALSEEQGLSNATFVGWAADKFDDMQDNLRSSGQAVSLSGVIDTEDLTQFEHPVVGTAYGPVDVVSALAWDINPEATSATIITTLGGVPESIIIEPPPEPIPEPASLALLALVGSGLLLRRRRPLA